MGPSFQTEAGRLLGWQELKGDNDKHQKEVEMLKTYQAWTKKETDQWTKELQEENDTLQKEVGNTKEMKKEIEHLFNQ